MTYKKRGYKKNFKKRKPREREMRGMVVDVRDNNVEYALRLLKRKLKKENWILELRKHEYYRKPSEIRREKRNKQRLRYKYNNLKEN